MMMHADINVIGDQMGQINLEIGCNKLKLKEPQQSKEAKITAERKFLCISSAPHTRVWRKTREPLDSSLYLNDHHQKYNTPQLIKSLKLDTMPPSTRAGQMGRGDDDQTTTGNGPKEGWLTQVVKILQLANPVLTAEEAIVRAMGLVSINNQAPCGETEKIPKDMSSSIAHIKKLSNSNWHTWELTFIDCLQRVHNAKEILYGTIAPRNKEYDKDLDKALVGLIHACCNNSPDSRINTYTVRGVDKEVQLGSTLYAKLKKALTLNDAVKRAGLQDCIHTVCHGPECSGSRRVTGSYEGAQVSES
ncbi:uncharacterized protein UDID_19159 [Ustilago sp. UG-2017a]|nr:uncharacterized protein UDID_19159 [Ustilago sp. UG-2017a]